jgi:hypothetical protein
MTGPTTRRIVISATALAATFAVPRESHAIFHWLRNCFCGQPAAVSYLPATSCPSPTVAYVPQTCYRAQVMSVPVTAMRPVTGVDPCTGCPVTYYRPTTACSQVVRWVPYTTYRAVAYDAYGCCAAPATSAYYGAVGCSGCSTNTYAVSATGPASSVVGTYDDAYTGSAAGGESTFVEEGPVESRSGRPTVADPQDEEEAAGRSDEGADAAGAPQLLDPGALTTRRGSALGTARRASWPAAAARESAGTARSGQRRRVLDDAGWRPSNR